jgi:crotonobetaine/carnitine-CoA ligase
VLDLIPQLEHVVVVGSGAAERLPGVRVHRFERLQKAPPAAPVRRDPDAVSLILYTSGTTGPSKGVVLTHRANLRLSTAVVENVEIGPDDVLFTAFPLFHVAARFVSIVPAMLRGGRVVVHRRFSASRFWDICRAERVTAMHYLGTLPMMLYKQTPSPRDRDHLVRVAYGAGMPSDIWQPFKDRFGVHHILELYGSTEQGITAINTRKREAPGTCGPPVPYASVEVHDQRGLPLPKESAGEIVVRPEEEGIFFHGYYGMAEETRRAWRNHWFHTGDQGRFDAAGNLVFLGRLKDSIRRRGENVSAFEVEQVADAHPAVAESAAVGVPSDLGEEEILLVVVPTDSPPDPAEVVHHCAERLPHFAVPRYVRIVDRLPKTPSHRVRKFELVFIDNATWDREASGAQTGGTSNG